MFRHAEDWRSVATNLTYHVAVGYGFLANDLSTWSKTALVVLCAQLAFFSSVISHNTQHSPVFRWGPLNRLFNISLTLATGDPIGTFVPGHNLSHHKDLDGPTDWMRTSKVRFRCNLLNQLLFTYVVGGALTRNTYGYWWRMRHSGSKWVRSFTTELIALVLVYMVLLYVNAWAFVLYVFLAHQFAAWGIVAVNFFQHDGCDARHPYNHSRNFVGPCVNWLLFNNGYHGMHHMRPGLHWSLLPEAHERELRPHLHPNLHQRSLTNYLWRAYVSPGIRTDYLNEPFAPPPAGADRSLSS